MSYQLKSISSDIVECATFMGSADSDWASMDDFELEGIKEKSEKVVESLRKRQKRLIDVYSDKFGMPAAGAVKTVKNKQEAESINSYITNGDVVDRLFGEVTGIAKIFARRPTSEDYSNYYEATEILIKYHNALITNITRFIGARAAILKLQADMIRESKEIRSFESGSVDMLYTGDVMEPVDTGVSLSVLEKEGYVDGVWLKYPFAYDARHPFVLLVKNNTETASTKNADFLRNIMYRIMRALPMYSYMFTYYDQSGGRNISSLGALDDIVNYNAYFLNDKLFEHKFKQLDLCTTKQEISESLGLFESYISGVNRALGDYSDIFSYNDAVERRVCSTGSIPQRFVFFENLLGATDDVTIIKKIIENSRNCGISLIMSVDMKNSADDKKNIVSTVERIPGVDVIEIDDRGCNITYVLPEDIGEYTAGESFMYRFSPCYLDSVDREFVDGFAKALNPEVKLDTKFEHVYADDAWWESDATSRIRFPVALNLRGETEDLTLGTSTYPFGMMCGHAGCGKSTFLHTIIAGVTKSYSPLDVQMWLIDYKTVEFASYRHSAPLHVRFIGLANDTSKQFTLDFLDKLTDEYLRRQKLFDSIKATSVEEYRNKKGKDSMPRLLVVIDEFHVMSDHIREESEYKQRLTAIFRQARAFGITILLADQTCGVGLKGLEDAAKKQITNRMAMQTDAEEQKAIFDVNNLDEVPQVQVYEVVMRHLKESVDDMGREMIKYMYTRCKTLYASGDVRSSIIRRSNELAAERGIALPPAEIADTRIKRADHADIEARIKKAKAEGERGVDIYIGSPLGVEKHLSFKVLDTYMENIMCISKDSIHVRRIVTSILESVGHRCDAYELFIFADENCAMYYSNEKFFENIRRTNPAVTIITDYGEICKSVCSILAEKQKRQSIRGEKRQMYIIWVGLENIVRVISNYSETRPDYGLDAVSVEELQQSKSSVSDLDAKFAELFGEELPAQTPVPEVPAADKAEILLLYNASEDMKLIFMEGGNVGIHSIVFYDTVAALKMTKCSNSQYFNHRIAFSMSVDEAGDFLRRGALIKDAFGQIITDNVAIYEGGVKDAHFTPFLLDEEPLPYSESDDE